MVGEAGPQALLGLARHPRQRGETGAREGLDQASRQSEEHRRGMGLLGRQIMPRAIAMNWRRRPASSGQPEATGGSLTACPSRPRQSPRP